MENIRVIVEETPNPNALKFIIDGEFKKDGSATFIESQVPSNLPLFKAIFAIGNIEEIHVKGGVMTISKMPHELWDNIEALLENTIKTYYPQHNLDFKIEGESSSLNYKGDLKNINDILDQTIRPALQADGGDLVLIHYENNILQISYQGACGSCPSATTGTLMAIENTLRQEFNPEIQVTLAY